MLHTDSSTALVNNVGSLLIRSLCVSAVPSELHRSISLRCQCVSVSLLSIVFSSLDQTPRAWREVSGVQSGLSSLIHSDRAGGTVQEMHVKK